MTGAHTRRSWTPTIGSWAIAILALSAPSCLRTLDSKKVECVDDKSCPGDLKCTNIDPRKGYGTCASKSENADGSVADTGVSYAADGKTEANAEDSADGRGSVSDGSGDASGDLGGGSGGDTVFPDAGTAGADAPEAMSNGSPCTADEQCASSRCVDGVCCATTCAGCEACAKGLTGKADGVCANVLNGQDPHEACADETATNQCGNDGTCDGNGACRNVGTSHVCTKASCSGDGKTFTPSSTCDGKGACAIPISQSCDGSPCAADAGCSKPCAAATEDCGKGNYCNTTTKTCALQKPNGQPATQVIECASGIVADGVCCDKVCTGCKACTANLNGQATNTTGQCLPVAAGSADPRKSCTVDPPCGLDGKCDGSGACSYVANNASCGADSCAGSTLTKNACDSLHVCTPALLACPNALICGSSSACKLSCTRDSDCVSGNFCASGVCKPNVADGSACSSDSQCKNGNCISGICSHTSCGTCNSCSTGICQPVGNGTDCGSGMVCKNGACGACAAGNSCVPASNPCKGGLLSCATGSPQCVENSGNQAPGTSCGGNNYCDGSGSCSCTAGGACTPTTTPCKTGAYSCTTGIQKCLANSGNQPVGTTCGSGMVCDGSGNCQAACTTSGSWTFESGQAYPWTITQSTGSAPSAATGAIASLENPNNSTWSLKVPFALSASQPNAEIGMKICSSGTTQLNSYKLTFDVWSDTPGVVAAEAWGPTGLDSQPQYYTAPQIWRTFAVTFAAVDANYVGIYLGQQGMAATGTMYFDNITLSP